MVRVWTGFFCGQLGHLYKLGDWKTGLRVTEWQTPKSTQYTGGWNFFVPYFNKLPYSLHSQGDKYFSELPAFPELEQCFPTIVWGNPWGPGFLWILFVVHQNCIEHVTKLSNCLGQWMKWHLKKTVHNCTWKLDKIKVLAREGYHKSYVGLCRVPQKL